MLTCVRSGAKPTPGSPQSGQFLKPLELPRRVWVTFRRYDVA